MSSIPYGTHPVRKGPHPQSPSQTPEVTYLPSPRCLVLVTKTDSGLSNSKERRSDGSKICSPNMLGVDSCVFLIFTTRVDQTNGSTLVKLILFEKSRVCVPFIINQTPAAGGDQCHGPQRTALSCGIGIRFATIDCVPVWGHTKVN